MKKKVAIFILVLVSLILLVMYISRQRFPFGEKNTSFATIPDKGITRIELQGSTEKIVLENKDGDWVLNGSKETRKTSVLFLLKVLTGIKVKSPVSTELFNSEIKEKKIDPVRVRVFENRKIIGSFHVYKTRSNIYGNIMKVRENSKPFIVNLPGYEGDIGSAFTLNKLFWQPHTVFNLLPSEIFSVDFCYTNDRESSFSIINNSGKFTLHDSGTKITGWDTLKVIRYLTYFTHVSFESWAFDMSVDEKEKISNSAPAFTITVVTTRKDTIRLSLWERHIIEKGGEKTYDSDRLWAKNESINEFFIIRYLDLDPLIKRRSYFLSGL